jgi:tellurite resistance protein
MTVADELDALAGKLSGLWNRGKLREIMEAGVANVVAFSHCDGTYGPKEQAAVARVLRHKLIVGGGEDAAKTKFRSLAGDFEIAPDVGLEGCERELQEAVSKATPEERRMIMLLGLSVAKAEGEEGQASNLGPEEKAWGARACRALKLSIADFPDLA